MLSAITLVRVAAKKVFLGEMLEYEGSVDFLELFQPLEVIEPTHEAEEVVVLEDPKKSFHYDNEGRRVTKYSRQIRKHEARRRAAKAKTLMQAELN